MGVDQAATPAAEVCRSVSHDTGLSVAERSLRLAIPNSGPFGQCPLGDDDTETATNKFFDQSMSLACRSGTKT